MLSLRQRRDGVVAEKRAADVCVIGASLGGVAAAWAACEAGKRVILLAQYPWIGGQASYQGVSCLDENRWIESRAAATQRYYRFRDAIRAWYGGHLGVAAKNPGNGWVSNLCFEPAIADVVLRDLLKPHAESGGLEIIEPSRCIGVFRSKENPERIRAILGHNLKTLVPIVIEAAYFLDATDLGDVIELAGIPYRVGTESRSETGEPHAYEAANPDFSQAFCYPFVVEFRSGETHIIHKPPHYEEFRERGAYTLCYPYRDERAKIPFGMFEKKPQLAGSFWEYRRIYDARQFGRGNDLALINWSSNDFKWGSIIDQDPEVIQERLRLAKYLSLGFLYWLQTECPRDDGKGFGYPEFKLRPDVMGTKDGLAMYPYIRESRRIVPRSGASILEQEISADTNAGARAAAFDDSVGIGHYMVDLHPQEGVPYTFFPTKPFQIPLRAFIPIGCDNLLPASKNIATTHLTNGAYRLHPVEWAIGEAAGMLAAFALDQGSAPKAVAHMPYLQKFQRELVRKGMPIVWFADLPVDDPDFEAIQYSAIAGAYPVDSENLSVLPDDIATENDWRAIARRILHDFDRRV